MAIIRPGTIHSASKSIAKAETQIPANRFDISKVPFRTATELTGTTTSEDEIFQIAVALFELTSNTSPGESTWRTHALLSSHNRSPSL